MTPAETVPLLIYGAYGYTGRLITEEAVASGLRPILSGRDPRALAEVAAPYDLPFRRASLDAVDELEAALKGVQVVLHCAGPFVDTAAPMVDACLRAGVHYLDITGEIEVFESVASRDSEAIGRGVTLLPGVGFDVVPSDCLAAHLARRLPSATRLSLAFWTSGGVSRGTAVTSVRNAGRGGAVRRGGRIVSVPAAWRTRQIDFGQGDDSLAVTIPWGDVSTAWHSTGIPEIEVYMGMTPGMRRSLLATRWLGWLLSAGPVKRWMIDRARARKPGPSAERRQRAESRFWSEATDPDGGKAVSRMVAPEGYTLTARTAVAAAKRVLQGDVSHGFQTPSRAFGPDFILEQEGVTRVDVL